ncbi:GA4 desaturase family protein [Cladophialophora carrionii]|uniref:GA4 desaturase family protein n=1 Tax=Cladophialophora carrionii TaxID=86049 RepID=A0A1C1CNB0_9EURO|nr:GA4 desaturase family protein [Cladophialophora carrionii]
MASTTTTTTATLVAKAVPEMGGDVETTINYHPAGMDGTLNTVIPGTAGSYRRKFDTASVTIKDIRGKENQFSLAEQGFQLLKHTSEEKEFMDKDRIKGTAFPEVAELLKKTTGATDVRIFSHIVRRTPWESITKEIEEKQIPDDARVGKIGPAHFAHIDQGPLGAQQLFDETLSPEEAARFSKTRWGIINVWRPIKPVRRNPLALCDMRSVPDEDLVPVYTRAPRDYGSYTAEKMAKSYQSMTATSNPNHAWYYASGMTPDEVLMLQIFDTNKAPDGSSRRTLHSAFSHPDDQALEPRESIEVRSLVFWENEPIEA